MKTITEILEVTCKVQKYQVKFVVTLEYGFRHVIGGRHLDVKIGNCLVKSVVPVNLFIDLGDTVYSLIHQALHAQYDLKERYDNLTAGIEYPKPDTAP